MRVLFSPPRLEGKNDRARLEALCAYVTQLANDLNLAMMEMEGASATTLQTLSKTLEESKKADPASNWNQIKSLIIKSADIIQVYQEKITSQLKGEYLAVSEFGTFAEETNAMLEATSQGITQVYENLQKIETDFEDLSYALIEVNAHINSGLLYYDDYGVPVYGLEIGQRTQIEGVEVFNKFARFTADKLSFYDQNGIEVAYISDRRLHIAHVEIQSSMQMGGFRDTVQSDGSVVTRWIGV